MNNKKAKEIRMVIKAKFSHLSDKDKKKMYKMLKKKYKNSSSTKKMEK